MVDWIDDIYKVALPQLILNWVFGIGIIEYPIGTRYEVISFIYIATILITYCFFAAYTHPFLILIYQEIKISQNSIEIIFYSNILIIIGVLALGWNRNEVKY